MCAPVARNSRASAQDRNLRSASTSIPGPKHPCSSRSRASACSLSRYGPSDAPSRLPVPDSAAASHRTCGNAPSRAWLDGRPKCSSFAGLSGTSEVDPSIETTRSPQHDTSGAPSSPISPVTCSNRNRTGAGPSLPRPLDSEEMFGGFHRRPCPASIQPSGSSCCPASSPAARRWWYSPSASLVITCPYPQFRPRNSHSASTKYITSRAGSSRRRCSRAPASATAASTSSGVKTLVRTPTEIRSGSHPSGDSPSEASGVMQNSLSQEADLRGRLQQAGFCIDLIMRHKKVTIPRQTLRQGHWPCWSWEGTPEMWAGKYKTTGHGSLIIGDEFGNIIFVSDPAPGCGP
jgi:hypothetical protein